MRVICLGAQLSSVTRYNLVLVVLLVRAGQSYGEYCNRQYAQGNDGGNRFW